MKITTVGVVSDTHGLVRNEAIEALRDCELIIHAGDIGGEEVIKALEVIGPVIAIRGNIDKGEWGQKYPTTEMVEINNKFIYILHDLNELDIDPRSADISVVICGHSHKPLIEERKGVVYLNPGSIGPRRFNLPITLAIIKFENDRINIDHINIPCM